MGHRCLVIGSAGQLGRALCDVLRGAHDVIEAVRWPERADQVRIDLADPAETVATLHAVKPEWIVLAGAFCNVDQAETQRELCFRVNVEGPRVVAKYAQEHRCLVVYYSTDQVFDGSREVSTESDGVHPLNVYAQSKVHGEAVIRALLPDHHLVIRTAWLYGPDAARRNFVCRVIDELTAGRPVRVASDQWGSPTYTEDLALVTRFLMEHGSRGTFHATGPEFLDRVSLVLQICSHFTLRHELIVPTPTRQLRQAAVRPLRVRLSSQKLWALYPRPFRTVRDGLQALREAQAVAEGSDV